jgi:hypothetical protein
LRFARLAAGEENRFIVLLGDQRTITVSGHALTYVPGAHPNDQGSYGILSRTPSGEVLVALFRVTEVIGVFRGDIQEPLGTAK